MASQNPWTEFTISETSLASIGSSTGGICGACPTGCHIVSLSVSPPEVLTPPPSLPGTDAYRAYLGLGETVWGRSTHKHGVRPVIWMQSGSFPAGRREGHVLDKIKQAWPAHVSAYDPQNMYHYEAHLTDSQFASGSWDPDYLSIDPSGSVCNVVDTIPDGSVFTSTVIDLGWGWNSYFWYFGWLDRPMYGASGAFEVRHGTGHIPDALWSEWREIAHDYLFPPSGADEIPRFHQWRVTVYASGAGDYRLFQVSYKALGQGDYDKLPANYEESNRPNQPWMSGSVLLDCGI